MRFSCTGESIRFMCQVVYADGDGLCDFYIVMSGRLRVQLGGRHITTLVDYSHFGEVEAFAKRDRISSVVAIEASQVRVRVGSCDEMLPGCLMLVLQSQSIIGCAAVLGRPCMYLSFQYLNV